ncbi:MAG TPA: hypothetical protein VGG29_13210 [Caulobacteraceae bacterium]|jgi:hypothetical protein
MSSRPTRRQVAEADAYQLRRQADFRLAADAVAAALARFEEVRAIALFGSCARPLTREVPRFQPFRQHGVEVLHECKDVDLAVWLDHTRRLRALGRARNLAVTDLHARTGVGVAHHQVDVFLFAPTTNAYLGRLCGYAECPKGKAACQVSGCGATPFLRQHEDFAIYPDALAEGRVVRLYEREWGWVGKAAEIGG